MDEKTYEEEQPGLGDTTVSKAWLKNTDKSITRLQNVKKTYYKLGGGPKERQVDCQCNYRSKHSSSFVNMDADPPKLSQESQETASNQDISVHDLLKTHHKKKSKNIHPKQRRRPYSATVCRVEDTTHDETPSTNQAKTTKAFIAVKGQNLNPQVRPQSGSLSVQSEQLYKGACLLHLDPQHVEQEERVRLEGLRKYSAYGQDDDDDGTVTLPKPPRASPELQSSPPELHKHNISPVESSDDESYDDNDVDLELQSLSEHGSSLTSVMSKPLVFQIPTAEVDEVSDDDVLPREHGALSADYVEKSEVFLDELVKKQTQETEELTEMFNKMSHNKDKVDNIDLRSVLSTPSTARELTTPTSTSVSVLNIEIEKRPIGGSSYESIWVEEPYIPRVGNYEQFPRDSHVAFGRYQSPKRRVQSATTTRRRQDDDTFVLRGKTFELMDAKDLAVSTRLSEKSNLDKDTQLLTSAKNEEVLGKPPRPKSSPTKKVHRKKLASNLNSRQKNNSSIEDNEKIPRPHLPRNPRKSSMRKSLSQGDVRCLSPEVIASVKKTVSFSDEVLSKPTHLLKQSSPAIKDENQGQEVKVEDSRNTLDTKESTVLSTKAKKDSIGVVIQNGQEVKEPLKVPQKSPNDISTTHDKARSSVNMIAQVKEATRCSCPIEGCHCRDITRPTMAVISQNRELMDTSPKHKLLKQRPSRPSSAPIKRDLQSSTSATPSKSRLSSAQHKRSGSEGTRLRPRPVSAHIRRPSDKEIRRRKGPHPPPLPHDSKTRKTKEIKKDQTDLGFVWGPGGDDVAASEECEEVYAKFKEKGINISMDTVKRGLMAPARRASESCMVSFGTSSSSGLLSRPETWLPEEYKRVKIWDDVLKKL